MAEEDIEIYCGNGLLEWDASSSDLFALADSGFLERISDPPLISPSKCSFIFTVLFPVALMEPYQFMVNVSLQQFLRQVVLV